MKQDNIDDLYASEKKQDEEIATLAVRMPKKMRDDFNKLCKSRNVDVSVVIRRFIERELQNNQK